MPIVTIQIQSDDPTPARIEGVQVQFYSPSAVFQTSGITNSNGEVSVFLLDGAFHVFLYKVGVSFLPSQPQQIVVDSSLSNSFLIRGHVKNTPESIDPLRCTIYGHILGVDGKGTKHRLVFSPSKDQLILSSNVIAPLGRIEVSSSDSGYFEFELLRGITYLGYFVHPEDFLGMHPGILTCMVPALPSIKLHDFLFPVPISTDFSATTITLPVSTTPDESVEAHVSFSDGSERYATSTLWSYVTIVNSDNTIAEVSITPERLCILPLTPGTTTITTERQMSSSLLLTPIPPYQTDTLIITVI